MKRQTNTKRSTPGGNLGIYFSGEGLKDLEEIRAEAESFSMMPSDYARRLIRIGRRIVKEDKGKLLES